MTYFDTDLEAPPVAERNTDPILPEEERLVFELIGFEKSPPDQYHSRGGIKWTFLVFLEDGVTPFVFNDEQYQLWRTTNISAEGKPLFTMGTQAHEWAQALLGRTLGVDDHFSVGELRGKRMSSRIVWQPKKTKPKEKAAVLASLRHVPVSSAQNGQASKAGVSADADSDEIDRKLAISKFEKKLERAKKKKLPTLHVYEDAYEEIGQARLDQIESWTENMDDELDAMD